MSQSGMKDQSGINSKLLIGRGKNWLCDDQSKAKIHSGQAFILDRYTDVENLGW